MADSEMQMSADPGYVMPDNEARILWGIIGSTTFAQAIEDVPDDWILDLIGPIHGAHAESAFAATVMPPSIPEEHRLRRLHRSGRMKGGGSSRLDAMKSAARFALECTRQGIDAAVFGMTAEHLKEILADQTQSPYDRAKAWLDEAFAAVPHDRERARQALNRVKYAVSHPLGRRDAEGRMHPDAMDLMSGLSDIQEMIEAGMPIAEYREEAESRLLDLSNEKERRPQDR